MTVPVSVIAEFVAMLSRHETLHPQRAEPADPPTS